MLQFLLPVCLAFSSLAAWPQADGPPPARQLRQPMQRAQPADAAVPRPAADLIPFIDAHAHLNDDALQLALMQRWGASQAVVFWGGRSSNESVAEAARAHPGQLIPFASLSPERSAYRGAWTQQDPALLAQLDALLATGLYMLEGHPNLYYDLSARTWPRHPRSPDYTILRDGKAVWPEWLQLIEGMPHRFLVGTDASNRSASADEMKFASVQNFLAQLSPAAREQVGRGTLLRLLGMKP